MEFAEGITSRKDVFIGQKPFRNFVIFPDPLQRLHVLPAVLEDVADDIRPPRFLLPIPDLRRGLVCPLRMLELLFVAIFAHFWCAGVCEKLWRFKFVLRGFEWIDFGFQNNFKKGGKMEASRSLLKRGDYYMVFYFLKVKL